MAAELNDVPVLDRQPHLAANAGADRCAVELVAHFPIAAFGHGFERRLPISDVEAETQLITVIQIGIDRRQHADGCHALIRMGGEMGRVIGSRETGEGLALVRLLPREKSDERAGLRRLSRKSRKHRQDKKQWRKLMIAHRLGFQNRNGNTLARFARMASARKSTGFRLAQAP
jgi:hypothetical protein